MSKVSDVCPSPNPLTLSSPPPPRSHCVLVGWDYLTPVLLNVSAVSLWGGGVSNKSPPPSISQTIRHAWLSALTSNNFGYRCNYDCLCVVGQG